MMHSPMNDEYDNQQEHTVGASGDDDDSHINEHSSGSGSITHMIKSDTKSTRSSSSSSSSIPPPPPPPATTTMRALQHSNTDDDDNKYNDHHVNVEYYGNIMDTAAVEWEDYKSSPPKQHQQQQQQQQQQQHVNNTSPVITPNNNNNNCNNNNNNNCNNQEYIERQHIHHRAEQFWHHYDQCIILSLGAQLGVLIRRTSNYLWTSLNLVFTENSALAPDLPVNCLALFILGLLSSGEDALEVLRYDVLQNQNQHQNQNQQQNNRLPDERREIALDAFERRMLSSMSLVLFPAKREEVDALVTYRVDDDDDDYEDDDDDDHIEGRGEGDVTAETCYSYSTRIIASSGEGTEQIQHPRSSPSSQTAAATSALSVSSPTSSPTSLFGGPRRRCRQSVARRKRAQREWTTRIRDGSDYGRRQLEQTSTSTSTTNMSNNRSSPPSSQQSPQHYSQQPSSLSHSVLVETGAPIENMTNLEHFTWQTEQTALTIAEGWDVGTTPEAMKEDLMLGLRVGFCGALSTFSSWNEDMVNLLRKGYVDHALVGYMLGITLPMVAYRIGQHVAISIFLHRARSKIMRDERRTGGYGLRIHRSEDADDDDDSHYFDSGSGSDRRIVKEDVTERVYPSVRAAITSFFALLVVAQITSIFVFPSRSEQQFAISLLFSPLGVLARRQLLQLNRHHTAKSLWRKICGSCFPACFMDDSIDTTGADGNEQDEDPRLARAKFSGKFPIGTFLCNILGCILSGSIGSLLAGNPGPTEGIVLESIILGFAGSLSTLAFLVEVLNGIDVLLAEFSGITYALSTLFWGLIVGLVSSIVA